MYFDEGAKSLHSKFLPLNSRLRGLADIRRRQGALHDAAQPVAPGGRQPGGCRQDKVRPSVRLTLDDIFTCGEADWSIKATSYYEQFDGCS